MHLENYAQAEDDASKSIEYNADNLKSYLRRAKARFVLKKYKKSLEDYLFLCNKGEKVTENVNLIRKILSD